MKKRLALLLPLVLALAGVYVITQPEPRQATYRGKTTGEWEEMIQRWQVRSVGLGITNGRRMPVWRWLLEQVSARFREDRDAADRRMYSDLPVLFKGEEEAVPVLVELLGSPDPSMRGVAAFGLQRCSERAAAALPALNGAREDGDSLVRMQADYAYRFILEGIKYDRLNKEARAKERLRSATRRPGTE